MTIALVAPPILLRHALLAVALASASTAVGASTCDALRELIDTKIKASGVTRHALTIVDADAKVVNGKVVGNCDQGRRKIVYERSPDAAPSAAAASLPRAPAPRPADDAILTECKDGRVSRGGECRK